jgi:hypothetical protein
MLALKIRDAFGGIIEPAERTLHRDRLRRGLSDRPRDIAHVRRFGTGRDHAPGLPIDDIVDEVDLRTMFEAATSYRQDIVDGRFIIETRHRRADWEVVVEPDEVVHSLVVITAYKVAP